jgi:hypothetical protein
VGARPRATTAWVGHVRGGLRGKPPHALPMLALCPTVASVCCKREQPESKRAGRQRLRTH